MVKIVIDSEQYYSPEEAAAELHIGIATLFRRIKAGKITPLKVSHQTLIPKSEVERIKKEAK